LGNLEPGLLGQKGFSRSDGFFEACRGIFQDGFDLAATNAGEPFQKFAHRGSVFQVFKQSSDGNSRSPKNTRPTDLVGTLLNAFAVEAEVHRDTIPREGSSSTKIPILTEFAGGEVRNLGQAKYAFIFDILPIRSTRIMFGKVKGVSKMEHSELVAALK